MARYIEKNAVVAEIEKKIKQYEDAFNNPSFASYEASLIAKGKYRKLTDILSFINTLEVKEVDLHKELDDYIERQKAWIKDDWVVEYNNGDSFNHIYDLEKIAKHFFELGLKVEDWEKKRMEECPYRQVGCTMYEGKILECRGACSWVVDYPKLKELKTQKEEKI